MAQRTRARQILWNSQTKIFWWCTSTSICLVLPAGNEMRNDASRILLYIRTSHNEYSSTSYEYSVCECSTAVVQDHRAAPRFWNLEYGMGLQVSYEYTTSNSRVLRSPTIQCSCPTSRLAAASQAVVWIKYSSLNVSTTRTTCLPA